MRRIKQKKLMELIDVVRRGLDDVICHGGMPETMQTVIHEYLNAFEIIEKSVMTDFSEKKQKEYQNISRGIRNGFNKITSLISHDKLDEDSDINVHNLEIDKSLAEIRSDLGKRFSRKFLAQIHILNGKSRLTTGITTFTTSKGKVPDHVPASVHTVIPVNTGQTSCQL